MTVDRSDDRRDGEAAGAARVSGRAKRDRDLSVISIALPFPRHKRVFHPFTEEVGWRMSLIQTSSHSSNAGNVTLFLLQLNHTQKWDSYNSLSVFFLPQNNWSPLPPLLLFSSTLRTPSTIWSYVQGSASNHWLQIKSQSRLIMIGF